jgi:AraC family transcriptional regulator
MSKHEEARSKALRAEYVGRINRVMDYIEANLDGDLSLRTLARVANFSAFHFHRIFRSIVGETLYQFIQRRRLEKAASFLRGNPAKPITEIAFDCGFSSSATFARAFKEAFGVSASQWRDRDHPCNSKICKTNSRTDKDQSKTWKDSLLLIHTMDLTTGTQVWRYTMNMKEVTIEVKDMPSIHVAYIRHIGPYKGDTALFEDLFGRLCGWAGPRGLIKPPETQFLCVYYDDPDITPEEKLRVDVCMTVPEDTAVEGEVGAATIQGGKYAVGHFELLPPEYEAAWASIMGHWLPQSGYQCDDKPCYELYLNDPKQHPEGRCVVDICVPVKPL